MYFFLLFSNYTSCIFFLSFSHYTSSIFLSFSNYHVYIFLSVIFKLHTYFFFSFFKLHHVYFSFFFKLLFSSFKKIYTACIVLDLFSFSLNCTSYIILSFSCLFYTGWNHVFALYFLTKCIFCHTEADIF